MPKIRQLSGTLISFSSLYDGDYRCNIKEKHLARGLGESFSVLILREETTYEEIRKQLLRVESPALPAAGLHFISTGTYYMLLSVKLDIII